MRFLLTLILFVSSLFVDAQPVPFTQLVKMVGQKSVSVTDFFQEKGWEYQGSDTSLPVNVFSSVTIKWAYNYSNQMGGADCWIGYVKNICTDSVAELNCTLTAQQYQLLYSKLPTYGFRKTEFNPPSNTGELVRTFRKGAVDVYLTVKRIEGYARYFIDIANPSLYMSMSCAFKK